MDFSVGFHSCFFGHQPPGLMWLWIKNGYPKWVALVNGTNDNTPRSPGGVILTHTHIRHMSGQFEGPCRSFASKAVTKNIHVYFGGPKNGRLPVARSHQVPGRRCSPKPRWSSCRRGSSLRAPCPTRKNRRAAVVVFYPSEVSFVTEKRRAACV